MANYVGINFLKKAIKDHKHPFWVIVQQFISRGLVALKFLVLARLMGPDAIGLISIALIILAIVEAITEIGLMQAIVQRKKELTKQERHIVWTLQFTRGVIITALLLAFAPVSAFFTNEPKTMELLYVIAFIPIFRNAISVGYYEAMRNQNFRAVSLIQVISIALDLFVSILLVTLTKNPISILYGQLFSEVLRVLITHVWFKTFPSYNFSFGKIKDITGYGKWIWGNSIASLIGSQFDKILALRFLGTTSLGYFQMGAKLTQLAIYDVALAMNNYLFPVFSKMNRENKQWLVHGFQEMLYFMFSFVVLTASVLIINSELLILLVLGKAWIGIVPIFNLMLITSGLAALLSVVVSFARAYGKPHVVTLTSYVQLAFYIPAAMVLGKLYEINGLIAAGFINLIVGLCILLFHFRKELKQSNYPKVQKPYWLIGLTAGIGSFWLIDFHSAVELGITASIYLFALYRSYLDVRAFSAQMAA